MIRSRNALFGALLLLALLSVVKIVNVHADQNIETINKGKSLPEIALEYFSKGKILNALLT